MHPTRTALFATAAAFLLSLAAATPALAASEPAGGAAISQIVIATVGAMVVTTALLWLCAGHRNGTNGVLAWGGGIAERVSGGMPGWAALPSFIATISLLGAVFGMYWDISLHIDNGRDEGPLANPAHYFILAGLFGIFAAGVVAMVMPKDRPGTSAIRITRDWHAPLGGVLIASCGAFALMGFPLDDVWHRLFGQDVTLWGPTHLMLIGGAGMTLIGIAVLLAEARRVREAQSDAPIRENSLVRRSMLIALPGGLLAGLSVFQAEFDFGVPQFRLVFHPILIMVAAGVALVAMRMYLGRGAAIGGVAFYLGLKGILALLVGGVFDEVTPVPPLYVAEALVVEAVALVVPREQPLRLGLICGALMGTVGLAAEWGWTHVVFDLPWNAELFPEGAIFGFLAAMAACLIGAWVGAHLCAETVRRTVSMRNAALAGAATIAAITVICLDKPAQQGVTGTVAMTDVRGAGGDREGTMTVRLNKPEAVDGAEFFVVTSWQGGGFKNIDMERVGPGTYRAVEPVPVGGEWKSLLRISRGNTLSGMPIYLPEDTAIPAREVPASPTFTRPFVKDHEILQREQKEGVASALPPIAYAVVAAIALSLLVLIAWGLHRFAVAAPVQPPTTTRPAPGAAPRATVRTA